MVEPTIDSQLPKSPTNGGGPPAAAAHQSDRDFPDKLDGTVTLVEKWSGTVGFGAAAMKHHSVVHLSGNDGRGDFPPDREAVGHLGRALSHCRARGNWENL